MGLSFEHARSEGTRADEEKIIQWWGSAVPHELQSHDHENYFKHHDLTSPQPHWNAQKVACCI